MKHPHPSSARWRPLLLAAPAALLLASFFLLPLLLLVRVSFFQEPDAVGFYRPDTWTLASYRALLTDSYFRAVHLFTVLLSVGLALLTLLVAYPLALFIHGLGPRARALALTAIVLPRIASALVIVYGLEMMLANTGPIEHILLFLGVVPAPVALYHNLTGVLVGETSFLVPYAVLILVAALDRIDPTLAPAARGVGAGPWQVFRRVTLPLSLPGLALAGQLCFIWGLGAFLGPLLLGGPREFTLSVEVQRQALEQNNWPRAAATAVLMLLTLIVCVPLTALPVRLARRRGGSVA